jgi:hypothetical protein
MWAERHHLHRGVARFLRERDLQREINEGLAIVESWNRANAVIFIGKGGDITTGRRDEQNCPCCACASCGPPWALPGLA